MLGLEQYLDARRLVGTHDDDCPPTRPLNPPEVKGELMRVTGELRLDSWLAKPPTERNPGTCCRCGHFAVSGAALCEHCVDELDPTDPQRMNVNEWPANDEGEPC
jgi:hypothetical protein